MCILKTDLIEAFRPILPKLGKNILVLSERLKRLRLGKSDINEIFPIRFSGRFTLKWSLKQIIFIRLLRLSARSWSDQTNPSLAEVKSVVSPSSAVIRKLLRPMVRTLALSGWRMLLSGNWRRWTPINNTTNRTPINNTTNRTPINNTTNRKAF